MNQKRKVPSPIEKAQKSAPHKRKNAAGSVQPDDLLRREHDFLHAVLTTAKNLLVTLDRKGRIVQFNRACERLTGYSFDEVKGRKFWELFILPEEAEEVKAVFTELSSGQFPNEHTNHWLTKAGDKRLIQWSNTALLDDSSEVEFVIGTGIDISERKQFSESLTSMLERLRSFVEHSPAAIYIKDENNRHIYGNPALLKTFGLSLDEFVGTTSHDFFPKSMAGQLEKWDEQVRTKHIPFNTREFTSDHKGKLRWWKEIKFPLPGHSNERLVGGVAVEIADIKENEIKLQKAIEEIELLKDRLEADSIYLQEEIKLTHNFDSILGESNELRYVLHRIEQVSSTDTTVLIEGETGTGKELVARAIHSSSLRKDRPLVKVDCTRLPSNLIESELFGHEKGAFTGAVSKRLGRFELADGSTIFLDEVADLPLELQGKLLQVLESGEFERLGSSFTFKTDVRVIAATNRNLKEEVEKGAFREDLYYRIHVFTITVPPLRQRKEDIPLLVKALVQRYSKKIGKTIDAIPRKTMDALQSYSWPGNIRELENVIEHAVITSPGQALQVELPSSVMVAEEEGKTLEDVEKEFILRILNSKSWRISGPKGAALSLGLHPETLRSRMKKLGIKRLSTTD